MINRIRVAAATVSCAAVVTMSGLAVMEAGTDGSAEFRSSGSMQTGVTTSQAAAAVSLATSVASPTEKAKPHWGQPSEP